MAAHDGASSLPQALVHQRDSIWHLQRPVRPRVHVVQAHRRPVEGAEASLLGGGRRDVHRGVGRCLRVVWRLLRRRHGNPSELSQDLSLAEDPRGGREARGRLHLIPVHVGHTHTRRERGSSSQSVFGSPRSDRRRHEGRGLPELRDGCCKPLNHELRAGEGGEVLPRRAAPQL